MKPADVLKENNCASLMKAIAENDFQMAQLLDVLLFEANWEDDL
ncbi:hypothetical protein [Peribacillus aracenensis]|nr:hypothetical protein [Peribacillus sp. BBB004]